MLLHRQPPCHGGMMDMLMASLCSRSTGLDTYFLNININILFTVIAHHFLTYCQSLSHLLTYCIDWGLVAHHRSEHVKKWCTKQQESYQHKSLDIGERQSVDVILKAGKFESYFHCLLSSFDCSFLLILISCFLQ